MRTAGQPAVAVVDYGMGNRRSVEKALEHVGAQATISREPEQLIGADGLVIPGVGAFPVAMRNLRELGLIGPIRECASRGIPVLGICLGMQLLFEHSEELGQTDGLGLIAGTIRRLETGGLRLPHIGWNEVSFARESPLTAGLPVDGCPFYHVHSFAARPFDQRVLVGSCEYGERFATIVAQDSVFGVQFHPEKSSRDGLLLLANFSRHCAAHKVAARRAAVRA
jgi:imidazole glycerol-phosphate synthase subunit HisH